MPAKIRVIEHARVKLACRGCEAHVSVAPAAPRRPIPRSKAGASLLAHVVVSKNADHLPLLSQRRGDGWEAEGHHRWCQARFRKIMSFCVP